MSKYLSPGVYVEEYDTSLRAVEGVGTSTAGFVGMAARGPAEGAPVLVTGYAEFTRKFGGYVSSLIYGEYRYLASSVEQFFANGGTRCYVSRVVAPGASCALAKYGILTITAANAGVWGNRIQLTCSLVFKKKMQLLKKTGERTYEAKSTEGFLEGDLVMVEGEYNRILAIFDQTVSFEQEFQTEVTDEGLVPKVVLYLPEMNLLVRYQEESEVYTGLSFNQASPDYIDARMAQSNLVTVQANVMDEHQNPVTEMMKAYESERGEKGTEEKQTDRMEGTVTLTGGSDGNLKQVNAGTFIGVDNGAGKRTGIQSFLENHDVSMMAVPGITMPDVVVSLVAHCENMANRFAVLDMPKELTDVKKLIEYREMIDSTYAAMYHPWIGAFDRAALKTSYFPPSGAVMGIYARTDVSRGVHKAPANETVMCSGLYTNFTTGEQDILNPAGINLIRHLPGQGIRVWGARTASSNGAYKYVNIRRLFIYVEESIRANTNWVVFEPNDQTLWTRVEIIISSFLDNLYRSGMLTGASPEESYFVEIGTATMTNEDIMNGRLICNIGIAPSRPAEFVIFRLTQFTAGAKGAE